MRILLRCGPAIEDQLPRPLSLESQQRSSSQPLKFRPRKASEMPGVDGSSAGSHQTPYAMRGASSIGAREIEEHRAVV